MNNRNVCCLDIGFVMIKRYKSIHSMARFFWRKKKKSRTQEMVFGIEIPGKAPDFIYESKPSLCAYVLGKIYCHLFLVFLSTNEALNDTYLEF